MRLEELPNSKIAIPGLRTSAYLGARLAIGSFEHVVVPFDEIMDYVLAGDADAGLLIHEGQLTYAGHDLNKVLDLGEWWRTETDGLPLPLGVNCVRRDLPEDVLHKITRVGICRIFFSNSFPHIPILSSESYVSMGYVFRLKTLQSFSF